MWEQAWLDYKRLKEDHWFWGYKTIVTQSQALRVQTAITELNKAAQTMVVGEMSIVTSPGDVEKYVQLVIDESLSDSLGLEGYKVQLHNQAIILSAAADTGILYGVFSLLKDIRSDKGLEMISGQSVPDNQHRMLNHWDNSDGSIERGYSGRSFFFKDGQVLVNERTVDYARLVASVGINEVVINNVNVAREAIDFITDKFFEPLAEMAVIFEQYGIKLFLSLDYAASIDVGGMTSADPLDKAVGTWWEERMKIVFNRIPNFGGFLIKADSEGRPGPFTYGRTQADGANMLARAVKPYGGLIVWRCFVYNCQQDWRDRKTDRARAGYDHFMPLDGTFDDNVVLQIKNGPMDFQVREPVSPLIGGLNKTNQILEFQIAQEYTGQQRHICYLVPMWKEILQFKTYRQSTKDTVADIVSGKAYKQAHCGIAAVANTGDDENWTGHDMAAANLYGYGRLIWSMSLSAEAIADEWACLTFGPNQTVLASVQNILMASWPAYEKYTSPLGIGWMVNPNHHYGPNVNGYEYDRWGTYHRADHKGIGVDRTEQGTGYISQYFSENAALYGNLETCPDELLLFFHHVSYTRQLKSGKTLIQHIYDSHFEGAKDVEDMFDTWTALEGEVESKVFDRVRERMTHQLVHSKEWRDVVNSFFYRISMIEDEDHREIF